MMTLSREDIRNARDMESITVEVPEWNGEVRIRPLTPPEAIEFSEASKNGTRSQLHERLVVLSCVDDDGKQLFQEDDIEMLKTKAFGPINRIADAALSLNHMTEDAKELVGKSGATTAGDSSTD